MSDVSNTPADDNQPVSMPGAPSQPDASRPDRADTATPEVIAGFVVHPLLNQFPLLVGKEFNDLVEAIRHAGTVTPVEVHDGKLIDGRNRVRAVEELQRQGVPALLPIVEWRPVGDETVEEHIFSVNMYRRHLTDDQRAALATFFLPLIRQRRRERQAASRFGAPAQIAAAQNPAPPDGEAGSPPRTAKEKDAASTVGQFAAMCQISRHKAMQAIALTDGVAAGRIDQAELDAVAAGHKRLREVVPTKPAKSARRSARKASACPPVELIFDEGCCEADEFPSYDGDDDADEAPTVNEYEVRERWERMKRAFAVTDHRELRRILRDIITEEQQRYDT